MEEIEPGEEPESEYDSDPNRGYYTDEEHIMSERDTDDYSDKENEPEHASGKETQGSLSFDPSVSPPKSARRSESHSAPIKVFSLLNSQPESQGEKPKLQTERSETVPIMDLTNPAAFESQVEVEAPKQKPPEDGIEPEDGVRPKDGRNGTGTPSLGSSKRKAIEIEEDDEEDEDDDSSDSEDGDDGTDRLVSTSDEEAYDEISTTPRKSTRKKPRINRADLEIIGEPAEPLPFKGRIVHCTHCYELFDNGVRQTKKECRYHPEFMEKDEKLDYFAEDDNYYPGSAGTWYEDNWPQAFLWTCCERHGMEEGCKRGYHVRTGEGYNEWAEFWKRRDKGLS